MKLYQYTAPSSWATYLINGDDSGMNTEEIDACEQWLAWVDLGAPVSCHDAGFCHWHDAKRFYNFAADCQTYTFLEVE